MDVSDRLIIENELAVALGRAVGRWIERNGISGSVSADVMVSYPSCYIDDAGVSHSGPLITVEVALAAADGDEDDC